IPKFKFQAMACEIRALIEKYKAMMVNEASPEQHQEEDKNEKSLVVTPMPKPTPEKENEKETEKEALLTQKEDVKEGKTKIIQVVVESLPDEGVVPNPFSRFS